MVDPGLKGKFWGGGASTSSSSEEGEENVEQEEEDEEEEEMVVEDDPNASTSSLTSAASAPDDPRYLPAFRIDDVTSGTQLLAYHDRVIADITSPLDLDIGGETVTLHIISTGAHYLAFWPVITVGGSRVDIIFRFFDLYFVSYLPPVPRHIPHILDISPRAEYRRVIDALQDLGFPRVKRIHGVDCHYTSLRKAGGEHRSNIYLGRGTIDQQINLLLIPDIYKTNRPAFSTSVTSVCQFSSEVWRLKRLRGHVQLHYTDGDGESGVLTPSDLVVEEHGWGISSFVLQGQALDITDTNLQLRVEEASPIMSLRALYNMVGVLHPYSEMDLRNKTFTEYDKIFGSKYH